MKASIITVCKNSEKTIGRTIESVISQKNCGYDVEYIVIDGKSEDSTLRVLKQYEQHIDVLVSEKDSGIYEAMNKGLMRSTGEVIGILNSDDWYEKDAVKSSIENLIKNDADISYGKMIVHHGDTEHIITPSWTVDSPWDHMPWPHPTVFSYKRVYESVGAFDTKYKVCADYDWLVRCYEKQYKFSYVDSVITNFSLGGISDNKAKLCADESFDIVMKHVNNLECDQKRKEELFYIVENQRTLIYVRYYLKEEPYSIRSFLDKYNIIPGELVLFGAGYWGSLVYDALTKCGIPIYSMVDNDEEKIGKKAPFGDITVNKMDEIIESTSAVIICVRFNTEEIVKQLKAKGVQNIVQLNDLIQFYKEYMAG